MTPCFGFFFDSCFLRSFSLSLFLSLWLGKVGIHVAQVLPTQPESNQIKSNQMKNPSVGTKSA